MKLILISLFMITTLFAEQNISMDYLDDRSAKLNIEDVIRHTDSFQTLQKTKFGFTSSAIWLRIRLKNNSDTALKRVLEFQDNRLDRIEIYKGVVLVNTIGDLLPFNDREIKVPSATFFLLAKANSTETYYVRITNKSSIDLLCRVYTENNYEKHISLTFIFYAFYFGAMVIMILYNFMLYIFIKERVFLEYIIYHTLLIGVMLYFNGFMITYYSPDNANMNLGNVPIALSSLTTLVATQFARSYLFTKKNVPKMDKFLVLLMGVNVISVVLNLFESVYVFNLISSFATMVIQSLLLFYIALYLVLKKNQSAKFYLLGWGIMLLAVIMVSLMSFGFVPRMPITSHLFQIASLFELLLLSMGMAFRYNLQHEIIAKQKQELYSINRTLENTISIRTEELRKEVSHTKVLLKDRDILFKELYHRVKNNLQMIVSILSMQKRRVKEEETKEVLEDITGRIKSLALIHEKLQTSNELDSINMQEYLSLLLDGIKNSYEINTLDLDLNVDKLFMNIDKVTSVGLVVNELVNNSFKHAFKDTKSPVIRLSLFLQDDKYQLQYSDNGFGDESIIESKSLGATLIKTLVNSQLKGSFSINTEPSISYTIVFPR